MRFVALLRGINLGNRNKVKMVELRELFTNLGFLDVHTYIQAGNVFFKTKEEPMESALETVLAEKFGFDIPVIIRTENEIIELTNHPFMEKSNVMVFFLKEKITSEQSNHLEKLITDPFTLLNDNQLLIQHTKNYHQTKFTNNYIEKQLHMYSTVRNKNTVLKLREKILL